MKLRAFQWLLALAFLCAANALYGWGGLAFVADLDPIVHRSAQREGALTLTYMEGGRWLLPRIGLDHAAGVHAEAMFAPLRTRLLQEPALAMELLHRSPTGSGHRLLLWSHWGAPLLLIAGLVAYAMRQKRVVTTRQVR